jgi:hypothetical protein
MEENRFTPLLSRMGFPAMCFALCVGLLITMPVFSSKPAVEKKQMTWKIQMTCFLKKVRNKFFSSKEDNLSDLQ